MAVEQRKSTGQGGHGPMRQDVGESRLGENGAVLDLSEFPSTRYQGSKRKILPWIWDQLKALDFSSALDVFGGTGSVSYLLKKMGKEVTYNDYLEFNYQVGLALIENDEVILGPDDIGFALTPIPNLNRHFVRDTFSGFYFTDEENEWIDHVIGRICGPQTGVPLPVYKRALLYYALFQSCLIKRPFNLFHRRNLYLRLAEVDRQFGNKTTWDQSFREHFISFCSEANAAVFKGYHRCLAINYDALDIPQKRYDLVYIDPPYLKKDSWNENADYRRSYHFLEGLCSYDRWEELIDYCSINLRFKEDKLNVWQQPDKHKLILDGLFEKFTDSIIVVSYKKFGIPSIDTLVRMLRRHGKRVRASSRHYKYALNHQNGQAAFNREVLLVGE